MKWIMIYELLLIQECETTISLHLKKDNSKIHFEKQKGFVEVLYLFF
jgi:hypothetical protein